MAHEIVDMYQSIATITTYITDSVNDTASPKERPKKEELIFYKISVGVYVVVFLLGTAGNGLVIYFATFRMKRTVNVMWFLNLAIADFLFTFLLIFRIVHLALLYHWPFGRFMCKLNSAIFYINLFASLFLITVISIDRLVSVKFPVWCQNHRTPRLASIVVLVIWILAFILCLPYALLKDTANDKNIVRCQNNYSHDTYESIKLATVLTKFIIGFVLPFNIIVLCYTLILLHIRRSYSTVSSKPFKVIAVVIIVFFVCWFPYHFFSFLKLSSKHGGKDLKNIVNLGKQISRSLAIMNSCVNPVLYIFMGRDFREKFRSSIQSIFEKAFMEEAVQTGSKGRTKSVYSSQPEQIESTFSKKRHATEARLE